MHSLLSSPALIYVGALLCGLIVGFWLGRAREFYRQDAHSRKMEAMQAEAIRLWEGKGPNDAVVIRNRNQAGVLPDNQWPR